MSINFKSFPVLSFMIISMALLPYGFILAKFLTFYSLALRQAEDIDKPCLSKSKSKFFEFFAINTIIPFLCIMITLFLNYMFIDSFSNLNIFYKNIVNLFLSYSILAFMTTLCLGCFAFCGCIYYVLTGKDLKTNLI